jgi:hypothetical protein
VQVNQTSLSRQSGALTNANYSGFHMVSDLSYKLLTALSSFLVKGFPDFVSSGGGKGGAGIEYDDDAFSASSTSGSRMEEGPSSLLTPS